MTNELIPVIDSPAPALVTATGARMSYRLLEFFTAQIKTGAFLQLSANRHRVEMPRVGARQPQEPKDASHLTAP
jgi:hypothetical protein